MKCYFGKLYILYCIYFISAFNKNPFLLINTARSINKNKIIFTLEIISFKPTKTVLKTKSW